ncbi:hypothetical protein PhaeoP54_01922 [Phaeobacter inhibens]|nr:hypothetical protein PhaeoP54_01922 [Phaeobacter inhibens]
MTRSARPRSLGELQAGKAPVFMPKTAQTSKNELLQLEVSEFANGSVPLHPLQKCPSTIKHLNLSKPPYVKKIYIKP